MNPSRALLGVYIVLASSALAACSPAQTACTRSADCRSGQVCMSGTCVPNGDAASDVTGDVRADGGDADAARPCTVGSACPGGVCVAGSCCPTDSVCGDACCGTGEVCFAGACVMPGGSCRTSADCASGSYCEPGLGSGGADAGVTDAAMADGSGVCSAPSPVPGRCLALPPHCADADGGTATDAGTNCIGHCEYRPPTGNLNSVLAWSWGQPTPPPRYPNFIDVWSTPAVGRIYDANCDGHVDSLDPPDLVFVSGHSVSTTTGLGTCCQCTGATTSACLTGVLRVLDGRTGTDLLAVRSASATSVGFAGVSVAIGDLNNDGKIEIAAVTGEGYVVIIDGQGHTLATSDRPIPAHTNGGFGWGGGLAIADMDNDGSPEIVYGPTVFTTAGGSLTLRFTGAAGAGGPAGDQDLSTLADLDNAADAHLELVAGRTAYRANGTVLWNRTDLPDGFPAVADLNRDGRPDVVLVANGQVWILDGATGTTELGPVALPAMGSGGPPTVADFAGTGHPQIGVAAANYYTVLDPDYAAHTIHVLWHTPNHDLSSSVTGSTVFDFEGDGVAEVLYADECFVWVFDGPTGRIKWAGLTTSFTATEASIVADIDGDGHAEIISISNGADPSSAGWGCNVAPWNMPDTATGRPAWTPPPGATAYRGIRIYRDVARSWVGTRPMWNEHTYHVSNVCVEGESLCAPPTYDGQIPRIEPANWTYPWLNNFRQNVQQMGLFGAPDATVTLSVRCSDPVVLVASVRNLGEALLPAGVTVGFYTRVGTTDTMIGQAQTANAIFPGGVQDVAFTVPAGTDPNSTFVAKIVVDPTMPTFRECRTDNDESLPARAPCPG